VELGAGCGLVSAVLGRLGAVVTTTDLEENLPLLRENLAANALGAESAPRVRPLHAPDGELGRALRNVRQVGARELLRRLGQVLEVDVLAERALAQRRLEHGKAALVVRQRDELIDGRRVGG
jgi:hypothetical protein